MPIGQAIKDFIEGHILFVVIGIFVVGFGTAAGMYKFFEPYLVDSEVRKVKMENESLQRQIKEFQAQAVETTPKKPEEDEIPPPKFPLRVGVFGPLTGPLDAFGTSQVRGVLSGIMHVTTELCGQNARDWDKFFRLKVYDTGHPEAGLRSDHDKLHTEFKAALEDNDVVFGPASSQLAKELILNRKTDILVPTFLTTAGSPLLRRHDQFGKRLFQVSLDIDSYSEQMVRYFRDFASPRPKSVVCIHRTDELGVSSNRALVEHAAAARFEMESIQFPLRSEGQTEEEYFRSLETLLQDALSDNSDAGRDTVVFVIAVGETLGEIVRFVRTAVPRVTLATITSIERDMLIDDVFDGVYVPYSYIPTSVTVETLNFQKYAKIAQLECSSVLSTNQQPDAWHLPSTVDAEVHDGAVYWLKRFVLPQWDLAKSKDERKLYSTDFLVSGEGKGFRNRSSVYIFQVAGNTMVPVSSER